MSSEPSTSKNASGTVDELIGHGAGRVEIDEATCKGCTMCAYVCPTERLMMVGHGKARKSRLREDREQCMACGACQAICDSGAIVVVQGYDYGGKWKQLDRGEASVPRIF